MSDQDAFLDSVNYAISRCSELKELGVFQADPKVLEELRVALGSLDRIKTRLSTGPLPPRSHRLKRYTIFVRLNNGSCSLPGDLKEMITRIEDQYARRT